MDEVSKCAFKNCSRQTDACKADEVCNTAWVCINSCDVTRENCRDSCTEEVLNNKPYWELNMCAHICIVEREIEEGDKSKLMSCLDSECSSTRKVCHTDDECKEALGCALTCGSDDYDCVGECMTENKSNAPTTPLVSLVRCRNQCIWELVEPSTWF